jgi:hypothetical protein
LSQLTVITVRVTSDAPVLDFKTLYPSSDALPIIRHRYPTRSSPYVCRSHVWIADGGISSSARNSTPACCGNMHLQAIFLHDITGPNDRICILLWDHRHDWSHIAHRDISRHLFATSRCSILSVQPHVLSTFGTTFL